MSSQLPSSHTMSIRNPRRRGRKEDTEDVASLRLQPVRKRHKTSANGSASIPADAGLPNGHASTPPQLDNPMRERRKISNESNLEVFVENENLLIGRLPALPQELRGNNEDYRGYMSPRSSLALAITRTSAYVWSYSSISPSPPVKSVRLPHAVKPDDPLPFGALVQTGSQGDVGLLIVNAKSGKVTFYESLENADALSLFAHRRNGTEGSMGLYSGETVVNIEDAHFAGFVVTTSGSRVAQLLLKDSQSRPSVNVHYLRAQNQNGSGGLLGGFLNVFSGGGLMRDVVATKVQLTSARGPAQVIIASEHGQFQQWQLSWSELPVFCEEWQGREPVETAIREQLDDQVPAAVQNVRLLDVDYTPTSNKRQARNTSDHDGEVDIRGVFAVSGPSFQSHALCSIHLHSDGSCTLGRVLRLSSYAAPLSPSPRWRPRLCVPPPSLTAFIFFDKAVVAASLVDIRHTQSTAQLSETFQDTIYLKDDNQIHFTGAVAEGFDAQVNASSALFLLRTSGVVRVVAKESDDVKAGSSRTRVSIKSKIEQAILYGGKQLNPLDLSRRPELPFGRDEVEEAVVTISDAVLRSTYAPLRQPHSSIDQQMQRRVHTLESLARHIKDNYSGLARSTRWRLLWDAEKLAAARELYRLYSLQIDSDKRQTGHNNQRKYLLPELVERIHEENRSITASEWDTVSHLEHFLTFDTDQMHRVLGWTYNAVYHLAQDPDIHHSMPMLMLVRDASEAACALINTALNFRKEQTWLYDLQDEVLEEGILVSGYEDLPAPWTSSLPAASKIYELALNAQTAIIEEGFDVPDDEGQVSGSIAVQNPRLIAVWCLIANERNTWSAAQPRGSEYHQDVNESRAKFDTDLTQLLQKLPQIDQTVAGMELAEKYHEMDALTTLVREESGDLSRIAQAHSQAKQNETGQNEKLRRREHEKALHNIRTLEKSVARYCKTFGYAFTNPYYGALVQNGKFGLLLSQGDSYKAEVTEFLRAEPARRPLAWINDVISERDYATAGKALIDQATCSGQNMWCRGIELGFAKLALLAADEDEREGLQQTHAPGRLVEEDNRGPTLWQQNAKHYDEATVLDNVQEKLLTSIRTLSHNALDDDAKLELLMEALGQTLQATRRNCLRSLLATALENLVGQKVLDAEALVDILTLMDRAAADRSPDGKGLYEATMDVFFLALLVVRNDSTLSDARKDVLVKVCWRRAMLDDDWAALNETCLHTRMNDEDTQDLARKTVLYRTLFDGFKTTVEIHGTYQNAQAESSDGMDMETPLVYLEDMPAPAPEQCFTAGTTVDDWLLRFGQGHDDLANPLAKECAHEEDWLRDAVEKHQLEKWWNVCRDAAMRDAMAEQ